MDVYLEGGNHLRVPMRGFIRRAVGNSISLDVRPCRDRGRAIRLFGRASSSDSLLLIDSEGDDLDALRRDVLARTNLQYASARLFFMVQLMEAWFLADETALQAFYGPNFNVNSLTANSNVENIAKTEVMRRLRNATRGTSKGIYDKTDHAPDLLMQIDPAAVYSACANFARLIDFLRARAAG